MMRYSAFLNTLGLVPRHQIVYCHTEDTCSVGIIHGTITVTSNSGQRGSGRNGYKGILYIPQSLEIASLPSDAV